MLVLLLLQSGASDASKRGEEGSPAKDCVASMSGLTCHNSNRLQRIES